VVTEKDRYRFDLEGYLVVPGALDSEQVAQLNDAIDRHQLGYTPDASTGGRRAVGFIGLDQAFLDLMANPRVMPYLLEWLGPKLRLDHYYMLFADAGAGQLQMHGGNTPYDPGQYYHVRNGRIYSGLMVVSYVLTPVAPGAGFACIPGSHKSAFPCPEDITYLRDRSVITAPPVEPGDAIIFTEALTHGTLEWASPHERRAVLYKYSPGHMTWMHPRWPDELLDLCTPEQRLLLEPPYYADIAQYSDDGDDVVKHRESLPSAGAAAH
jgi:ectoine hydroxylase-related dioxygenase (phytanoyl-CoA dioxygenase family)